MIRFKVMENLGNWGKNTVNENIIAPLKAGDPLKAGFGVLMTGASAILEAPDYVFSGLVNQELSPPASGTRVGRDIDKFRKDLMQLHIVSAALAVIRLPGSFVMDIGQQASGLNKYKNQFHSQVEYAMAHPTATSNADE